MFDHRNNRLGGKQSQTNNKRIFGQFRKLIYLFIYLYWKISLERLTPGSSRSLSMVFMRGRTSLVFLITSSIVSFLSSNQRLHQEFKWTPSNQSSNVNDIETKRNEAKRSFDLGIFSISKRNEPCLFQKFYRSKRIELCLFHNLKRSKRSDLCLFQI